VNQVLSKQIINTNKFKKYNNIPWDLINKKARGVCVKQAVNIINN